MSLSISVSRRSSGSFFREKPEPEKPQVKPYYHPGRYLLDGDQDSDPESVNLSDDDHKPDEGWPLKSWEKPYVDLQPRRHFSDVVRHSTATFVTNPGTHSFSVSNTKSSSRSIEKDTHLRNQDENRS